MRRSPTHDNEDDESLKRMTRAAAKRLKSGAALGPSIANAKGKGKASRKR